MVVTAIALPWFFVERGQVGSDAGFLRILASQVYGGAEAAGVRWLLLATYALSIAYGLMLLGRPKNLDRHFYLQLTLDLALITGLVYTFGGIQSPFHMLYAVVILLAAFNLGGRIPATTFATVAFGLYTSLLLGIYFDWQWPSGALTSHEPETTTRMAFNIAVALVGFYGVAALGTALARRTLQAERELAQKQDSLANLRVIYEDVIQSVTSGLITTSPAGVVSSVNRAGEGILGLPAERLVGRKVTATGLFTEASWTAAQEECDRNGKSRDELAILERESKVFAGYTVSRLKDAEDALRGYIVIFQDLTERRRMQQELRIRDRMAAVGQLAAGIAHEIGNPLAAISGSAQMLASAFEGEPSKLKLLEIVLKESQRLDRIVKDFLQYARPRDRSVQRFDIAGHLAEDFALLENSPEVRDDHRLVRDLGPGTTDLEADPDQVSQIFWNLAKNALQAMPDGGELRITGRATPTGGYRMEFRDTGIGMEDEERTRLFQPFKSFFSQGTGLGMAIVYRIVEEHSGRIQVESTPRRGTTIAVELPGPEERRAAENDDEPVTETIPLDPAELRHGGAP